MTAVQLPQAPDARQAADAEVIGPQMGATLPGALRELYVVGGQQRSLRPVRAHFGDWYEYQKGIVLRMDVRSGAADTEVAYVSAPEVCPPVDPAVLFKSGTRVGDKLYLTTQTEVVIYSLPDFAIEHHISLPFFNDVHHARPTPDGNVLVAITGLDMVAEISLDGHLIREWNALDLSRSPFGDRFSRDIDYRRWPTTKPHLAHPNHVFYIGDEPWATRFEQQDAISLLDPGRRIPIGVERLHDGIVYGDRVFFTAVNGKIAIVDAQRLVVDEIIDLNEMHGADLLLGWCRGLLLDGDLLWVGYSRMRPTKFRENVAWVKNRFRRWLPTHVGLYDLRERRCLAQLDVERHGLNAVFGIYAA